MRLRHLTITLIHCGCHVTFGSPALGCGKAKTADFSFLPADLVYCPYKADIKYEVLLSRSRVYLDERSPVSPALT